LRSRGHDLLADDVVAIDAWASPPQVFAGFPQLKLWPSAAEQLGVDPSTLPRLQPDLEKREYRVADRFCAGPVSLGRIYTLEFGDRLAIERLEGGNAFAELVRHTYLVKYLDGTGTSEWHFRQCAQIARTVPLYRATRPRSLPEIARFAQLLEEHGAG
jgi:hypothetical protein